MNNYYKKEIQADAIAAYKNFCHKNRLIESIDTAEYFITYFINIETKAGYKRAGQIRNLFQ